MQTVAGELIDFQTNRERELLSFPSIAQIMLNIQQIIDTIYDMSDCNGQVSMVSVQKKMCHLKDVDFDVYAERFVVLGMYSSINRNNVGIIEFKHCPGSWCACMM